MQTISLDDLATVTGGMTVPGGPQPTPKTPNWWNGVKEGYRGYSEARQQGQEQIPSAWAGVKRGARGLFNQ